MSDTFHLDRFVAAQTSVMDQVRRELQAGRKRTHWMWFVFPQLAGLGHSATAQHYAIGSLDEARAYLAHPLLGQRLIDCTGLVTAVAGRSAREIFGAPDDMKFHSCMTLFALADPGQPAFGEALDRYFDGRQDPQTLDRLGQAARPAH